MSRATLPRNLLRTALLAVAVFCFWQALAPLVRSLAVASPGGASAPARPSGTELITTPIQASKVGQAVPDRSGTA